ncbi:MAG: hypothetical protein HY961_03580 [Ignavibacteriae bacterium]|nr:hypothetical protein [Ignavibacteriota bacterium]
MRRSAILFLTLCLVAGQQGDAQLPTKRNLDSLGRLFNSAVSKLTSPQLEARKQFRLDMQRKGYADMLSHVVADDGFSAFLSYARTMMHIDYSISHQPLYIRVPIVGSGGKSESFALPDDWTFPKNPWEKKK